MKLTYSEHRSSGLYSTTDLSVAYPLHDTMLFSSSLALPLAYPEISYILPIQRPCAFPNGLGLLCHMCDDTMRELVCLCAIHSS